MLHLTNGTLRVGLTPERGAEIQLMSLNDGPNALAYYDWMTPALTTPIHQYGGSELDWLSAYRGGWQETIPNAGSECTVRGVPLAFHGEASVLEWTIDEATETSCTVSVGLRLPVRVTRMMTIEPNQPTLRVETRVHNESPLPVQFVWGHHPCFPAVDGTTVEMPARSFTTEPAEAGDIATTTGTWPNALDHDGRAVDISTVPDLDTMRCFYLHDHLEGWAVVRQPGDLPSVAMSWDVDAYPATWLWQMRGEPNYPWFGRMRVVAVEPQSAWPYDGLVGAIERGQAITVAGDQTASSWLTMTVLDRAPTQPVARVNRDGSVETRS
jgi:galactose mutarotase-like enzyme